MKAAIDWNFVLSAILPLVIIVVQTIINFWYYMQNKQLQLVIAKIQSMPYLPKIEIMTSARGNEIIFSVWNKSLNSAYDVQVYVKGCAATFGTGISKGKCILIGIGNNFSSRSVLEPGKLLSVNVLGVYLSFHMGSKEKYPKKHDLQKILYYKSSGKVYDPFAEERREKVIPVSEVMILHKAMEFLDEEPTIFVFLTDTLGLRWKLEFKGLSSPKPLGPCKLLTKKNYKKETSSLCKKCSYYAEVQGLYEYTGYRNLELLITDIERYEEIKLSCISRSNKKRTLFQSFLEFVRSSI